MKTIKERLEAEEQDEKIIQIKDKVNGLIKMSRGKMSEKYATWDRHNDVYQGVRPLDKEDIEAQEHKEPEKMVVPMSFAQIQTFVAFAFLLLTQNRRFFEFVATGAEDYDISNDAEEMLERDLRRNYWNRVLFQSLLDSARFGIGVIKHWWEVDHMYAPVNVAATEKSVQNFNYTAAAETSMQKVVKYEGNKILNISPYNFFPDVRFPLAEWRRGSFVGDETEWHISELRKWETNGVFFGVDHIQPMEKDALKERGDTRLKSFTGFVNKSGKTKDDQVVCITSCQLELIPKNYDLGPEEVPLKFVVSIANDQRVVGIQRAGYLHDEPTYDIAQYSPDMHQQIGDSLADTISSMQDVVSYLINSRLTSVRRSLEHNLIIDPSGVDMSTVESRSPWIMMKKGSPRLGVDKFIRQLQYVDTTASHFADADVLMKIMQMVTGVNENSMGQVHGGRRSATENRAANQGAAARMKLVTTVMWQDCYASLGRKMLINSRQGVSEETFVKVLGESARPRHQLFSPSDPLSLIGVEDHFVFDSTIQSEKGFIAQSLQELVGAVLSNPIVMQVLPIDIGKLMEEILQLRGVDNIERFRTQPQIPQNGIANALQGPNELGPGGSPQGTPTLPGL